MEKDPFIKKVSTELTLNLPSPQELIPLNQSLITTELALAFDITPLTSKPTLDLNNELHPTYSTNLPKEIPPSFEPSLSLFPPTKNDPNSPTKLKRVDSLLNSDSNSDSKDDAGDDSGGSRAVKRPRLVWTVELHKRFVEVIEKLGIDKAVPKTIMEGMNVSGLTRENVASHLQKYRLYLKRRDGSSDNETQSGPRRATSFFECDRDQFNPISPPPPIYGPSLPAMSMPMPMPMPMPMGMPHMVESSSGGPYGLGHIGLPTVGNSSGQLGYYGLDSIPCNVFWNKQRR